MPVIRIDNDVWAELKKRAEPLVDNPNSVLRRILHLDSSNIRSHFISPVDRKPDISSKNIEVEFKNLYTPRKYALLPLPKAYRQFFPGYKVDFDLETNCGIIRAHVTSAPKGTLYGDPDAGKFIVGNLSDWYNTHQELKRGDILHFECLEPGKRYRLSVRHS